jgi:hypothetical protein
MSVRSFHSVFMVTVVAGAALGCYLVSLRVASERAALDQVQRQIFQTQYDIRMLQTEIGTRARLAQLERWNVRVLALSAPSADQILGDKFQLARMVTPETRPAIEAPLILATAPARVPEQPPTDSRATGAKPVRSSEIMHQAGLKVAPAQSGSARDSGQAVPDEANVPSLKQAGSSEQAGNTSRIAEARALPPHPSGVVKKTGEKTAKALTAAVTRTARTATIDPLAPLPTGESSSEGSRTDR